MGVNVESEHAAAQPQVLAQEHRRALSVPLETGNQAGKLVDVRRPRAARQSPQARRRFGWRNPQATALCPIAVLDALPSHAIPLSGCGKPRRWM
jgi:hypothetical protein